MKLTIIAIVGDLIGLAALLWSHNLVASLWAFNALLWATLVLMKEIEGR